MNGAATKLVPFLMALSICVTCRARDDGPVAVDSEFEAARKTYFEQGAKQALPMFEQLLARYESSGNARGAAIVIGLIGKDLYPLSAVVQAMRKTQQTSLYLDRLGPFFVGRAVWKSALTPAP